MPSVFKFIIGWTLFLSPQSVVSSRTAPVAFLSPRRSLRHQVPDRSAAVASVSDKKESSQIPETEEEESTPIDIPSVFSSFHLEDFDPGDFLGRIVKTDGTNNDRGDGDSRAKQRKRTAKREGKSLGYIEGMVGSFKSLISGSGSQETISDIVSRGRDRISGDVEDTTSFADIIKMLNKYKDEIRGVAGKYIGDIDLSEMSPTAVLYYLEREDEVKNPSWKRRIHRFCPGIDMDRVEELNDDYELARLSYSDTVDELREGLENFKTPFELVFASVTSEPGAPASYVAVKRDQPGGFVAPLEVLMAVRGTKDIADAITDILCDTIEYREGKSHALITESGKFLVETHSELLQDLLEKCDKQRLSLKIVGHSLGAGAASIAGIEFDETTDYDIEVVGFGCPPLVTENLAEKYDFITTVINDADVVPRVSGASLANLLRDILDFEWHSYAKRDIAQVLTELERLQPTIFNNATLSKVDEAVEKLLMPSASNDGKTKPVDRLTPELFPPGNCIHFYRDGSGMSGCYIPNTFFTEIDLNRRMIQDHLSDTGYLQTFVEVMREQTGDKNFRFDSGAATD